MVPATAPLGVPTAAARGTRLSDGHPEGVGPWGGPNLACDDAHGKSAKLRVVDKARFGGGRS